MKKRCTVFSDSKKKAIISCSKLSVLVSLFLFLPIAWMPGLVPACFGQSPWTTKSDMLTARKSHSACLLDGKIYVIGGKSQSGSSTTVNEIYDPATDTWTTKANMEANRVAFSTCLYNGKILAIGGSQSMLGNPVNTIEEYDPNTDKWTYITDIPKPGLGLAASLVNDTLYIIGGAAAEGSDYYTEIQKYDLKTNQWTTAADLPTTRNFLATISLNGKIYAMGGTKGESDGYLGLKTVEEYDPAMDTWTQKTDMITARKNFFTCVLNGKIFVFGGSNGNCGGILSSAEVYDPDGDTWTALTSAPGLLGAVAGAALDGRVYLTGGNISACPPTVLSTTYAYEHNNDDLFPTGSSDDDFMVPQARIFPNPVTNILTIQLRESKKTSFEIISHSGQSIFSSQLERPTHQIDLSSFQNGVYFITIRSEDFVTTRKIIKL